MIPRNLWHMGAGMLRRKLSPPEPGALLHYPSIWRSRAGLKECKFGSKMVENGYFRMMELSIWYACGTQGILHACARNRWYFVYGSQGLRHYKDIALFQPFEVHSRNVYWDDNWFFILAQFRCPETNELLAEGLSRIMLRHGRDRVDSRLLYAEMGLPGLPDREMPEVVKTFLQWDAETDTRMKQAAERNAVTYANQKRPPFLSVHSMNLPFLAPEVKRE